MPEIDPEKLRLYDEGCAEYARTSPEGRAHAIAKCTLCDDDGYRANQVCDHIDRTTTAARGIAKCREALARKQLRLDQADQ
ncbi:hypothetical protein [Mycolicibacterium sp. XJ1819]